MKAILYYSYDDIRLGNRGIPIISEDELLVGAVQRTPMLPGDRVVVMGLGSVGLLMLQAVKAIGAVQVYGIDLRKGPPVPDSRMLTHSINYDIDVRVKGLQA